MNSLKSYRPTFEHYGIHVYCCCCYNSPLDFISEGSWSGAEKHCNVLSKMFCMFLACCYVLARVDTRACKVILSVLSGQKKHISV